MPTAARWPCAAPSSLSSSRLGLTSACATRKQRRALVVVDDDHVEVGAAAACSSASNACAPQSTVTISVGAALLQFDEGFAGRAVALHQPVGDVDDGLRSQPPQQQHQQRSGGRAVDVIVAEDRDRFALLDRVGETAGAFVHVPEAARDRAGSRGFWGRDGAADRRAPLRGRAAARRRVSSIADRRVGLAAPAPRLTQ